jgi:hypothetical protein
MAKAKQKLVEAENEEIEDEVIDNEAVDETEEEETDPARSEEDEEEEVDESAGSDTLHPGAGSSGGTEPSRMETISRALGLLANVDKDTLKYFNGMMSSQFRKDFGVPEGAKGKNQGSIKTHPSDAVASVKEVVQQEVAAIFEGHELSPEFKEKATILFEASLEARVNEEKAKLNEAYEAALEEEVAAIHEAVETNVAMYCDHVGKEWMKENEVAIESSLRNEIVTEFMEGLRELFNASNVNIPEEQVEVVDALAEKVDELETSLAEAIKENAALREVKEKADRTEAVSEATKGMTLADAEKVKTLCEGVEAEGLDEFNKKLGVIKDSLKKNPKKSTVETLMEEVDPDNKTDEESVNPQMRRYVEAIRRTVPTPEKRAS